MAWYKTGTIAISDVTVTGVGTNWTDNKMGIGPGQALLIPGAGTVKMYEILRVDSATKITLKSGAGTVAAGSAYAIMSFYTDSVPDFARRLAAQLSYYQSQMDGWQSIMTGAGTINIEAPDGTIVAISSFKKLTDDMAGKASLVSGAVPIAQGGTGATTATQARANLYLGTAAVAAVQTSATDATVGRVLINGYAFGLGSQIGVSGAQGYAASVGFYGSTGDLWGSPGGLTSGFGVIQMPGSNTAYRTQIAATNSGKRLFLRATQNNTFDSWVEFYSTGNTTKSSDGTLKAASPVCRIVKSQTETERADIDEDGYSWCGAGTANEEASGITITRQDVGVYVITGAVGLAEDGWRLLPPRDPNGSGDLGIVDAEESNELIIIRLYKRRWQLTDDGDIELVRGALMDVPVNSWIDVRLNVPDENKSLVSPDP